MQIKYKLRQLFWYLLLFARIRCYRWILCKNDCIYLHRIMCLRHFDWKLLPPTKAQINANNWLTWIMFPNNSILFRKQQSALNNFHSPPCIFSNRSHSYPHRHKRCEAHKNEFGKIIYNISLHRWFFFVQFIICHSSSGTRSEYVTT